MSMRNCDEDRRKAQRFEVTWEVAISGTEQAGGTFREAGRLENLSSIGALLCLSRSMNPGERIELQVKVPFRTNNWMTYKAQVIRVAYTGATGGIAVKFDTARPGFIER